MPIDDTKSKGEDMNPNQKFYWDSRFNLRLYSSNRVPCTIECNTPFLRQ